ncbi:MAG: cytochrome c [Chloroflexi bacterium]|nr:cytochrome c [Chloroflexota bacterium]
MTTVKRDLVKLVGGGILLAGILAVLSACGSSTGGATPVPTPRTTATATATATATPTGAAAPTTPAGSSGNDLLVQGKLIFEKTAGGVGCASCHGLDGKGSKTVGAPDNRGASEAQVRAAIDGGVAMMSFIKLSDQEITAVVAYLQYLNEQP